jgi:hypothetical protein
VVAPPSIHPESGAVYEWIAPAGAVWQWCLDELPVFDPNWLNATSRRVVQRTPPEDANIERARRYIARIVAISGQGGHDATFRAACQLADRGLREDQMMEILLAWNETNANPKWTEAEIRHKVEDALKRGCMADTAELSFG